MTQQDEQKLVELLKAKRLELWRFFHECQEWTKQKEAVKPFDDLLAKLETAKEPNEIIQDMDDNWKQELYNKYEKYFGPSHMAEWSELIADIESLLSVQDEHWMHYKNHKLSDFLAQLPRKFWEDQDHAVGGYISKKDLFEILRQDN